MVSKRESSTYMQIDLTCEYAICICMRLWVSLSLGLRAGGCAQDSNEGRVVFLKVRVRVRVRVWVRQGGGKKQGRGSKESRTRQDRTLRVLREAVSEQARPKVESRWGKWRERKLVENREGKETGDRQRRKVVSCQLSARKSIERKSRWEERYGGPKIKLVQLYLTTSLQVYSLQSTGTVVCTH